MIDQASRLRELVAGEDRREVEALSPSSRIRSTTTRVIAVTSGKGGVGKTTVAVNLALVLAESGKSVLLVDADLGLANVDVMLGLESPRHIGHLLLPDTEPEDVVMAGPSGISIISGGSGLKELADATDSDRRLLLRKLEDYYGRHDYVVIDTSPGIGSDVIDFLKQADEVLLLTTPEPTSLRDTYAAIKTIMRRVPDVGVHIVVNIASSETQAAEAVSVLNEVASKFLGRHYDEWHRIAHDAMASRAISAGRPLVMMYPRSPASVTLRVLAKGIVLNCESKCNRSGS